MRKTLFVATLIAAWSTVSPSTQAPPQLRWYKGNTHTHTTESDGDSHPEDVAAWYRDNRYNFVVMTDHNFAQLDALIEKLSEPGKFIIMKGEEVTSAFKGKSVHVNGLDTREQIGDQKGSSAVEVLQRGVDAIRKQQGVPHINHPNFQWALTAEDLRQVRNVKLLEIYNGHPEVNSFGGGDSPSVEAVWDTLLSSGNVLYGVATDDAHNFKHLGSRDHAGPGRGWIRVRAAALEPRAIIDAMERGDFYATTGIALTDYRVTPKGMTVTVHKNGFAKYRIQFIGKNGRLLQEALDSPASYGFRGSEGYVRAKVIDSNGRVAWLQPYVLNSH